MGFNSTLLTGAIRVPSCAVVQCKQCSAGPARRCPAGHTKMYLLPTVMGCELVCQQPPFLALSSTTRPRRHAASSRCCCTHARLVLIWLVHMRAGTVAYMSPQVLQLGCMSKAADVYSFALLMLEVWIGDVIYRGVMFHQVSAPSVVEGVGFSRCRVSGARAPAWSPNLRLPPRVLMASAAGLPGLCNSTSCTQCLTKSSHSSLLVNGARP